MKQKHVPDSVQARHVSSVLKALILPAIIGFGIMQASGQSCTPPPFGIVSWWPAETNADDIISGNNGSPTGGITYTNGKVNQAFVFNGSTSYIPVPSSTSLDIGGNTNSTGLSIECWIKPTANVNAPIVEWDSSSADGVQFWVANDNTELFANIKDTSGSGHAISYSVSINTTNFQHVAVTYDKSSGTAVLYYNGSAVETENLGSFTPQTSYPTYQMNIGRRTGEPIGLNDTYGGLIDELSIYNRALTACEIQGIFDAGSAGKCR